MSPQDLASQLDLYAEGNQGLSTRSLTVENTHYYLGSVKAYGHAAQLIRDHLVPRWTKNLPTAPGAYWYQDPRWSSRMHRPILVTVWRFDGHETLYAGTGGATGDPQTVEEWAMKDAVWYGPFCTPVDPPSP